MRFKLTLALLSCFVMFAYVSHGKQKQEQALQPSEENSNIEFTSQNTETFPQEPWREWPTAVDSEETSENSIFLNPSASAKTVDNYPETDISGQREVYVSQTPIAPRQTYENAGVAQGNYMTLTPTNTSNAVGNPIYELRLYSNGQLVGTYQTVTGRANSQNRNRHQAGTHAPLPDGQYQVANAEVAGTHPEVGGRFLPIQPLFPTGRSALGIHYDPSFQKSNGEDGTEGCIALTNKRDLDQVLQYVHTYRPQYLEVKIQV
jgi:hypothetical protein